MNAKRFVPCLLMIAMLGGGCLISCGNTSSKDSSDKAATPAQQADDDFRSFLAKFTSSAAYQYKHLKFPMKSPITLMTDDGNTEKTFPFTKEKWPLLDGETLKEERITQEEGGVYVSKFVVNNPTHKEFEAGYEDSEIDLRVVFDLIEGSWYVTDCYSAWYSFDLPIADLRETILQVQEENKAFEKIYP
ncbi:DUF4348 domain-containing protein [uncultured Bacteroides sp.]|uniref:DUF4348 domain-containing protein n=1 Tax=uncultured Bacteroides sp. TaxID=162156 RepID=UPI002AA62C82|nr:DUF4348 domain-containing protein [uncultured Bacteroides sp.]